MSSSHKVLVLDYILRDSSGQIVDRSEPGEPMVLHLGANMAPEGLEEGVRDMVKGDHCRFTVSPEKGFGPRDERMVQDLPRAMFPKDMDLTPGSTIAFEAPDGTGMLTVVASDDESVRCDFNHPLAGESLDFEVTCLDVEQHDEADCDLHLHDETCEHPG